MDFVQHTSMCQLNNTPWSQTFIIDLICISNYVLSCVTDTTRHRDFSIRNKIPRVEKVLKIVQMFLSPFDLYLLIYKI
jgi:hypothetical protein